LHRAGEALLVAAGGGVVAGATGTLLGLTVPAAAVGVVHGAIAGHRRIYPWRQGRGWVAFALDHSWALITSFASLVSHLVAAVSPTARAVPELSERQTRHVYLHGLRLKRGYMLTVGNVISGARDLDRASKVSLIKVHENLHVWQARWFGPFFPLVYAAWFCLAGAGACIVGVCTRQRPLGKFVEGWAYYRNPFEWWAYSREGRWPPTRAGKGWRRPLVRPLATVESPASAGEVAGGG